MGVWNLLATVKKKLIEKACISVNFPAYKSVVENQIFYYRVSIISEHTLLVL